VTDTVAVPQAERSFAQDLIALTKPKIISLLLVTTIAPMYVAGSPDLATVFWVFVGGYLMAGGANAVNMYIDRDIDDVMARTRLRPIPSGRMSPRAVIAFGVLIATAATYILGQFVNVLTAALALAGFYFYVFIYTRWLKRSSPQNIVIGGAAGAFRARNDRPDGLVLDLPRGAHGTAGLFRRLRHSVPGDGAHPRWAAAERRVQGVAGTLHRKMGGPLVVGLQVLAALPRAPVRRDGHRPTHALAPTALIRR
jgi:hypothetical protein